MRKINFGDDVQEVLNIRNKRDRMKKHAKVLETLDLNLLAKRAKNYEKIKYYEKDIEILKGKTKLLANVLKSYYLQLLKAGIPTKINGIAWIIENNLHLTHTSDLDQGTKKYIFKYANLFQKSQQLQKQIDSLKDKIKTDIMANNQGKIDVLMENSKIGKPTRMSLSVPRPAEKKESEEEIIMRKAKIKRSEAKKIISSSSYKDMRVTSGFHYKRSSLEIHSNLNSEQTQNKRRSSQEIPKRTAFSSYNMRRPKPTTKAGLIYEAILQNKNEQLKSIKSGFGGINYRTLENGQKPSKFIHVNL